MLPGIDHLFILHCKKGYAEREASIREQMEEMGIEFEFYLDHDVPDLTANEIARFSPTLTKTSMSVCLKHFGVMEETIKRGYSRILVFEDDVLLEKNFKKVMKKIVAEQSLLPPAHVIYLSNACHKYIPRSRRKKGQHLYESDHSRAADAYLITDETCRRRLVWLKGKVTELPIDHLFNKMDWESGVKIYWAEDPIVEQGSMNGKFNSHLPSRFSPFVKAVRWKLDKLYKFHILRNLR